MVRAFEYFATSRSLYGRLRDDFELPSISTLTRLSSKVNNSSDISFINAIFANLKDEQKQYTLLIDEIYVKTLMTYHGGALFGKSVNNPESLATTVLGFMLVPVFQGPSFLVKMLPVNKLDAEFMYDQSKNLINHVQNAGGIITSIICDNNRVNQAFFKKFDLASPWKTVDGIFLLFDFVHILKSIRNNWLTEKTGEIEFEVKGETLVAKWEHIRRLQKLEDEQLVKMSKLSFVAANPKPVERQKVDTCLRVFCDETKEALINHPGMQEENVDGTVTLITKVIEFWSIVNVKSLFEDVRLRNPLRSAITSPESTQLDKLWEFAEFAAATKGPRSKREKKLTFDTGSAIEHTCKGLIDLARHLLQLQHCKYVLLGKFTTDPIERAFGKLRQGSGGTYFINVQQILE
jgi:hypothetical protein